MISTYVIIASNTVYDLDLSMASNTLYDLDLKL